MHDRYSKEENLDSIPLADLNAPRSTLKKNPSAEAIKRKLSVLDKLPINEAARLAVSIVGPRVYKLKGLPGDKLTFYVIGCSGNGKKSQADVARLMEKMASRSPEKRPAFIISAGDFLYPAGAPHPTHPVLKTNLYDMYPNFKTIACLGNHEEKRFNGAELNFTNKEEPGLPSALNVVAANYVPDGVHFKTVSEITEFFMQPELDVNRLQTLTIPYYYFAIQCGDIHLTFANSNCLPRGYLDYSKIQEQPGEIKSYDEETYQIPWLIKNAHDFEKMFHLHVMHNPRYPVGKRAVKPDTGLYLSTEQQRQLNDKLNSNVKFYHEYINLILEVLGLKSKAHISAHEHLLDFVNTAPLKMQEDEEVKECSFESVIRQIGAGGGGGDLQRQNVFPEGEEVGTVLSRNGFWEVTIDMNDPKDIDLNLYAIDYDVDETQEIKPRIHLKFDLQSSQPKRVASNDENVEILRSILLNACKNIFYIKELQRTQTEPTREMNQQSYSQLKAESGLFKGWRKKVSSMVSEAMTYFFPEYKPDDIDFLHDLIADLNVPEGLDLQKALNAYIHAVLNLENKSLFVDEVRSQILLQAKENHIDEDYFLSLLQLQRSELRMAV